jgi:histidinol-phosphate/aromatic aminotransferase/cobyric acid decarboxylase-like protein
MAAQSGGVFGVDTGYNYQISGGKVCRDSMTSPPSAAYTDRYPMATYSAGERICLAWPSKNHVAASCTNPYIPDTELVVALSPVNPTSDPTEEVFMSRVIANLTEHQNGVIDFKGFQHCPAFCENMDKSFCSQCFNLPSNLALVDT